MANSTRLPQNTPKVGPNGENLKPSASGFPKGNPPQSIKGSMSPAKGVKGFHTSVKFK